jgi:uncharacterized protein YbjT (DUF2867 family)
MKTGRVLLTGATGFVGGAAQPALLAAGWQVRCTTRGPARAPRPQVEWITADLGQRGASERALSGCDAALYLVHGMGEGRDFHGAEVATARRFGAAARAAGVRRIVYLGGLAPAGRPSEHLRSRLDVGAALRESGVPTLELRASMIVGHGSLSWLVVRDLAARLPVMVLPTWLRSRTQPVAIDDVVAALVAALQVPFEGSATFDLPGPQVLTCRQILDETARALGLSPAAKLEVPLLTPRLSSLWVRMVTRARWSVARHVVLGLTQDLLARDARFWELIDHRRLVPFDEAARRALAAETEGGGAGAWGLVERLRHEHRFAR